MTVRTARRHRFSKREEQIWRETLQMKGVKNVMKSIQQGGDLGAIIHRRLTRSHDVVQEANGKFTVCCE